MPKCVRLVQLSDLLLEPDSRTIVHGVNPYLRLETCVDHLQRYESSATAIVVTGNLVRHPSVATYNNLKKILGWIKTPVYVLPGNRDDATLMCDILTQDGTLAPAQLPHSGRWDGLRVLLLDSAQPGQTAGKLSASTLRWIEAELRDDQTPTVIFLHHPPVAVGIPALDTERLENTDAFFALLRQKSNVRGVFFGHVQQPLSFVARGVPLFAAPSTAYTLGNGDPQLQTLAAKGAFRVIELEDDTLKTWIQRFDIPPTH